MHLFEVLHATTDRENDNLATGITSLKTQLPAVGAEMLEISPSRNWIFDTVLLLHQWGDIYIDEQLFNQLHLLPTERSIRCVDRNSSTGNLYHEFHPGPGDAGNANNTSQVNVEAVYNHCP